MQTRGRLRHSRSARHAAATFARCAIDFLYPPACELCHKRLADSADPVLLLCSDCQAGVAPMLPHRCERCSAPVGPYVDTQQGCIHCRSDRFAFERVFSLGAYDGLLRTACLHAKRQTGDVLTAALADLLIQRELQQADRRPIDLIVSVPHHWTERILRRHLPPDSLALRVARGLSVPYGRHILAKVRRTRPQTELSHTERRQNLRGAFRLIGKPDLTGLRILLVDDVLTTGTTAHRAASELKRAGASVNVAVFARGLGSGAATAAPGVNLPRAESAAGKLEQHPS